MENAPHTKNRKNPFLAPWGFLFLWWWLSWIYNQIKLHKHCRGHPMKYSKQVLDFHWPSGFAGGEN